MRSKENELGVGLIMFYYVRPSRIEFAFDLVGPSC
jgi:hypothetical protein